MRQTGKQRVDLSKPLVHTRGMPQDTEAPTVDEQGTEHHPAFGMCRVSRVSASPGVSLFQSDLPHREFIEVTLSEAVRYRNLKQDWVHPQKVVAQFRLSMAQWASLISSTGTEGSPVTISYAKGPVPGLVPESRLQRTIEEVASAAHDAYAEIQAAQRAYFAAVDAKAPAAERKALRNRLAAVTANAESNVDFAAKMLDEHAEEVVTRSKADIEAMVRMAQQRGSQVAVDGIVLAELGGPE